MNSINRLRRKFHTVFNESTNSIRVMPDFIVCGTSFCAKTFLYNNINQHKLILNNLREESGFFLDTNENGLNWYKSNFPSFYYKKLFEAIYGKTSFVGETVNLPGYFVPKRVFNILKNPKIIVILRNPVDRAFARYLEEIRNGNETKSFEDALENELNLIKNHEEEIIKTKSPLELRNLFLYRLEGLYIEYLKQWNEYFPIKNMHIVKAESLFSEPLDTVNKCFDFLGIEHIKKITLSEKNNEKNKLVLKKETRDKLSEYFEGYNQKLYQFLGIDFGWA
ncbi:hypothetical protein C5F49_00750 [Nitrosopumilus oxyclinae]|uniref:Sulfotransferase domain-containing protein n=2 Tax=Nitrosopumilus oxyclinae TaxID=1959104 RepID=A0A7D5M0K0_9ARCH|nr:hypothetical protein C5F49_00750 [Nitrosopumilus oxyclinae]